MSGTALPGVPPNITLLVGPELVGVCVNWLLWGILTVQVYYYFTFYNDDWPIRTLVIGLFILDSAQSIFSFTLTFKQLASGWGNLGPLSAPGWSFEGIAVFSGIISFCVQIFFAYRIYTLSKVRLKESSTERIAVVAVIVLIICTATAQCLAAFIATAKFVPINNVARISVLNPEISVWLGGSSACDVMITITMVILLRKAKQRSTFSTTHRMINKLMQNTVETGMVTAVTAVTELILFLVYPHTSLHIALLFMLAKLYTNTLLATLNSRQEKRSGSFESHSMNTIQRQTFSSRRHPQTFNIEAGNDDPTVIQVQTVKHIHQDADGSESLPDVKLCGDSPFSGYHRGSGSMD